MASSSRKRPPNAKATLPSTRSGNPAVRGGSVPAAPRTAPKTAHRAAPKVPAARVGDLEVPEVLPEDGVEYPQILRTRGYVWWRSLLGVLMALSFFLLIQTLVSQVVVALAWTVGGRDLPYAEYYTSALSFQRPSGMLAANLGIATAIPIAWVLMGVIHRVKPRWLASVQPRMRWPYLLGCLVIGVLALNGMVLLSHLLEPLPPFQAQSGFWGFLVVILLTSPLQAAAEEVLFRGYLLQALGSLVAQPWFGVVVSSLVFALMHGTQNLPLFLDRLAFGLLAAILVWRTGGIEAGIAAHVVNNLFAYLIAGLTTSVASLKGVKALSWLDAGFDVAGFALFALLAYALARRLKLHTRVALDRVG